MANKTINLDSLKEGSVHIYKGMISVSPYAARELTLDLSEINERFNECYSIQCRTVGFVSEGELYVTPCSDLVIRSLEALGFKQAEFYVPFNQNDYPKNETEKWVYLKEMVIQSYIDDFIEDCTAYSNEQGIGTLSEEVLKNCMAIPFLGLPVIGIEYETCYYPILNIGIMEQEKANYIGRYNINEDFVAFVYRDGRTYVTKGYRIIKKLKEAGYKQKNMFVPLSSGERIKDKGLQKIWESIKAHLLTE